MNPKTPPLGWRLLKIGEIVKKGDKFHTVLMWRPATGETIGHVVTPNGFLEPFIRKLNP